MERAVGKDAFGEVVEERHGEFVVDGSLVRRRVVEDLANPVRLLVVMQKLVDEGNVYLQLTWGKQKWQSNSIPFSTIVHQGSEQANLARNGGLLKLTKI